MDYECGTFDHEKGVMLRFVPADYCTITIQQK